MTDFIDYTQVVEDMRNFVRTSAISTSFKAIEKNQNDRDYHTDRMPLLDFRIKRALPDPKAGQNYYVEVLIEAEIAVFDLTSRDDAATICGDLVNALQRLFQENPRFSSGIDATIVGVTEFGTGETKEEGAFVAAAVLEFSVFKYADR